ncbi:MAG TPA: GspE/PulE family protein [Armatimonadota bacterium]|jgi:type II secretory ATPase GspE/PulE/Tfp pilus assembly ATPase PilB-like protein
MTPEHTEQVLAFLQGEMDNDARRAFQEALARSPELRAEMERGHELLRVLEASTDEAVSARVNAHIQAAVAAGASDIHVVPGPRDTKVFLRVDGALRELEHIPKEQHNPLIDRWKTLADCDVAEHRRPQDGRLLVRQADGEHDLRVAFVPTVTGERLTARLLARSDVTIDLEARHFAPHHIAAVDRLLARRHGLIVVTGVGGSGKTTVLYSMLRRLTAPGHEPLNIMSVEDPVEMMLEGVSQVPVDVAAGVTFASATRAAFRSDLDVLMVGEIRNLETAELCLQAAVTGHLVLCTLHVDGAVDAVQRLIDMGVAPFLLSATFAGATHQRLVRRLCPDCSQPGTPTPEERRVLGLPEDAVIRRAVGCPNCHGGYNGRLALFEVVEETAPLRRLIAASASTADLWREAFQHGGSITDDARARVLAGDTSPEEALR